MQLEDHLGDILRKARVMSGVTVSAAATAAGISETELSALEETGNFSGLRIHFASLGTLLGLHSQKLEGIVV